jgi:hypothetical protein
MGFDASQFVVGGEWVYRLRDDAASCQRTPKNDPAQFREN